MLHLKDAFQASSYFIYKYIVETSLLLHASTFDILSVSFPSKMMYVCIYCGEVMNSKKLCSHLPIL